MTSPTGSRSRHPAPVVETASGRVAGTTVAAPDGTQLARYLGIPYAASPAGPRRWRLPEPPTPWAGVRAAREFGPPAPQTGSVSGRLPGFALTRGAEDCLSCNVWAPVDPAPPRPVLVWIHGGAFSSGGAAQPVYDATRLAAEVDAVVVTLNYRLGALGFLALPGAERDDAVSNCGLHDQLAALRWVQRHAEVFGGDPGAITVIGESAGAGSILHLLASRAAAPVQRAIVQSGEPRSLSPSDGVRVRDAFVAHLGLTGLDVAELRAAPLGAILDAQRAVIRELGPAMGLMPFHPVLDGSLVDRSPRDAVAAGRASSVDLVIGTNRDELALFPDPRAAGIGRAELVELAAALRPAVDPEAAVETYEATWPGRSPGDLLQRMRTDAVMWVPALRVADAHTRSGGTTYVYRFDWEAPGFGAAHAIDLPFTFGTFDREGWGDVVGWDGPAGRVEGLGRAWREAFSRFGRSGAPGAAGLPPWPRHDPASRPTMCFAARTELAHDPAGNLRAVWMGPESVRVGAATHEPVG